MFLGKKVERLVEMSLVLQLDRWASSLFLYPLLPAPRPASLRQVALCGSPSRQWSSKIHATWQPDGEQGKTVLSLEDRTQSYRLGSSLRSENCEVLYSGNVSFIQRHSWPRPRTHRFHDEVIGLVRGPLIVISSISEGLHSLPCFGSSVAPVASSLFAPCLFASFPSPPSKPTQLSR